MLTAQTSHAGATMAAALADGQEDPVDLSACGDVFIEGMMEDMVMSDWGKDDAATATATYTGPTPQGHSDYSRQLCGYGGNVFNYTDDVVVDGVIFGDDGGAACEHEDAYRIPFHDTPNHHHHHNLLHQVLPPRMDEQAGGTEVVLDQEAFFDTHDDCCYLHFGTPAAAAAVAGVGPADEQEEKAIAAAKKKKMKAMKRLVCEFQQVVEGTAA
eukprot:UC1_evm1s1729